MSDVIPLHPDRTSSALTDFELLVFTVDPRLAREVIAGGAAAIIVDWEYRDKVARQLGADTEINRYGPEELSRLRHETEARLVCRVNGMHDGSRQEVENAIASGADEILLPMVRRLEEVERVLEWTDGRADLGILIETSEAIVLAPEFAALPLRRIYVGLNDLAIERRSSNIFEAVVDGTLDRLRGNITTNFGFGGLTIPDGGHPIPCRLLRGELIRLGCNHTFLRRSFWRDVAGRDLHVDLGSILESIDATRRRTTEEVAIDQTAMREAVSRLRASA